VISAGTQLTAHLRVEPGEEILATYGAHSNDKLLVHCKDIVFCVFVYSADTRHKMVSSFPMTA
jgi:hypothetical protein